MHVLLHDQDRDALRAKLRQCAEHLPEDPNSPGARLAERFAQMRKTLASEDDPVDFQVLQRDTVREIEREYRDSARRERLKRLRNKERKGNGTRTGGAAGALSG